MSRKSVLMLMLALLLVVFSFTSCKKSATEDVPPLDSEAAMEAAALENTEGQEPATVEATAAATEAVTPKPTTEVTPAATVAAPTAEPTAAPVVATLEPTAAPAVSTPAATAQPGTYTVQVGDNLFRIALNHKVSVDALAQANGITNPAFIYVGQVLKIPGGATTPATPAAPATPAPSSGETVHYVQPGENLFRIALRYNFDFYYLARYNGINNPALIYVGQPIRIPAH